MTEQCSAVVHHIRCHRNCLSQLRILIIQARTKTIHVGSWESGGKYLWILSDSYVENGNELRKKPIVQVSAGKSYNSQISTAQTPTFSEDERLKRTYWNISTPMLGLTHRNVSSSRLKRTVGAEAANVSCIFWESALRTC